jgi:hypothetical protein
MGTVAIFLFIVATVAVVYGVGRAAEAQYLWSPPQIVRCPETGKNVCVTLDATLAAMTAIAGPPKLLVTNCELWPERQFCDQACVRRG